MHLARLAYCGFGTAAAFLSLSAASFARADDFGGEQRQDHDVVQACGLPTTQQRQAGSQPHVELGSPAPLPSGPALAGPITLEALERLALARNPTLVQASALIDAARGRQIQAGLYPNPTLGYVASEIGNEGRGGQQGIAIGQEIVRGGKRRLAQTAAGFELQRAEAQAAAQRMRVLNAVRTLFYETLAAERTVALTSELQKLAEQGVTVAQQRRRAGEATLAEVLQAQIEADQVRITAAGAANNYAAVWQRLAATVGDPDLEPVPLSGDLDVLPGERDRAAVLQRLMAESPEIHAAEAGTRRAEAALQRARVESVPNVTIEANTQYDFASNTQLAGVAISFPIPLYNRNQGNILAAQSDLISAHSDVDRTKLALTERLGAAFGRYRDALARVERYGKPVPDHEIEQILTLRGEELQQRTDSYQQILPRAQLGLALATEGYRRGEFSYLQVLTAQRTLTEASLAQVRALANLRQSVVALDGLLLSDGLGSSVPGVLGIGRDTE
jgi:cobalt-zinc-cadmium efflux system outer membrane protein